MKNTVVMIFINLMIAGQAFGGNMTAKEVIEKFDLKPLPEEGGYYRETYRSAERDTPNPVFGFASEKPRHISTAIYFLVTPESFSALHRIKSDEIFHFYGGDAVEMIQIDPEGHVKNIILGSDFRNGEVPQVVVPKGHWQALKVKQGGQWGLMGTTVAPGFEFEDLEVMDRDSALVSFPHHESEVMKYTRIPSPHEAE